MVTPEPEPVKGTLSIWPRGILAPGTTVHAVARFHPEFKTGVVNGWVQFYDFRTRVGAPVQLVGGEARFTYGSLGSGPHLFTARYLGTERFEPAVTLPRFVYVRR